MNAPKKIIGLWLLFAIIGSAQLWAQRAVSAVVPGNHLIGTGAVGVILASQGDEAGIGFSVTFDSAKLRFDGHSAGSGLGAAQLHVNPAKAKSGKLGIAIAMSAGAVFAAGDRQLVVLRFTVVESASCTVVAFDDAPIAREVVDPRVAVLTAEYRAATIAITRSP